MAAKIGAHVSFFRIIIIFFLITRIVILKPFPGHWLEWRNFNENNTVLKKKQTHTYLSGTIAAAATSYLLA